MLVLSRKPGESIIIAGEIKITILEVIGNRVRVGIEAPKHIPIVRAELDEVQFGPAAKPGDEDTQKRPKTKTNISPVE
jgi:carbon storage regulator CsrA